MTAVAVPVDPPDFDAIVVAHHAEIRRYLLRVTARGSEAEDLAQETFLRAYRAWSGLAVDADRRAWLYTIATNVYRNHVRAERRRKDAHAAARLTRSDVDRHGPESVVAAGETHAGAAAAIARLPEKQRLAFTMRKLEELDYEIIGRSLDCTAETARAHVFQALRKLRRDVDVLSPAKRKKP